jgi:hypothetical protein
MEPGRFRHTPTGLASGLSSFFARDGEVSQHVTLWLPTVRSSVFIHLCLSDEIVSLSSFSYSPLFLRPWYALVSISRLISPVRAAVAEKAIRRLGKLGATSFCTCWRKSANAHAGVRNMIFLPVCSFLLQKSAL